MRAVDPSVQLIACGSSGPGQSTFLEWDREVLEECYSQVDGISLHRYYGNEATGETRGNSLKYLAMNLAMEEQIDQVAAVCEYVRKRAGSSKRLWLSFDEWNVWYRRRGGNGQRQQAPHLLEEEYNLEDALLVGGLVNALLRRSDKVRVACLAQLVNVIAPIVTNANGLLRQSIYYPYSWALESARGQALDALVESAAIEGIPAIDGAVTFDESTGQYCVLLLNRDLMQPRETTLVFRDNAPTRTLRFDTLTGTDLKAVNTFADPGKVKPAAIELPRPSGRIVLQLPARSYSRLLLQAAPA
jgi:alpha-N-arabinofuranosidase